MIVGVLLAGGTGSRFGGDKLVASLRDGRAVAEAAAAPMVAALDEVVAVVRPDHEMLAAMLQAAGCVVVARERAREGMGASLAEGVRARADADGWIIGLADMPWIRPATITRVAAALERGARLAAPRYRGRRGHPVGFAADLRGDLLAQGGDTGARAIIAAHEPHLELVDSDDPGVVVDIDTRAGLDRDPGEPAP